MDASAFFKDLAIGNLEGTYHRLLVAPNSMKTRITALIDREIAKRPQGLYLPEAQCHYRPGFDSKSCGEASQAGVQVEMIVRGICCILPQVEGETENIGSPALWAVTWSMPGFTASARMPKS